MEKWITLYDSVFIVLNDVGQVVSWQFTSSTSFDEIKALLSDLKTRLSEPITVFVASNG